MKIKFNTISDDMLEEGNPSRQGLTPGNVYRVIEISGDDVRVMDDKGEPVLFPLSSFTIVDDRWPDECINPPLNRIIINSGTINIGAN